MSRSLVRSTLLDLIAGLVALGGCALALLVQPYSGIAFEYLLLGLPAVLFPLATVLRASRSAAPRAVSLVLVCAPVLPGAALLAHAANAGIASLLPTAAVVLGASLAAAVPWPGRWARGTALACAVLAALALVPRTMSSWLDRPSSNVAAPDVSLRLLDGTELPLRSLRGRVVVLNFWGVYCPPCVAELPELGAVVARFRGDARVAFAAVEVGQGKSAADVEAFARQHGLQLPVAYDPGEGVQRALEVWGTPTTLVIDPAGAVRRRRVGYAASAGYTGWLTRTIEELASSRAGSR